MMAEERLVSVHVCVCVCKQVWLCVCMCVCVDIHMCDMTHSYVGHDSFIYVT